MSTDLHTQLVAAVNARLEVARAYLGACGGSHGWCGDDEREEFQQAGDPDSVGPDSVVRHCERDLRVLERHAPLTTPAGLACDHCQDLCHSRSGLGCESPDAPWPCPDVRDLAVAYGLDPTAGE